MFQKIKDWVSQNKVMAIVIGAGIGLGLYLWRKNKTTSKKR